MDGRWTKRQGTAGEVEIRESRRGTGHGRGAMSMSDMMLVGW
jgi:hypothetical protein